MNTEFIDEYKLIHTHYPHYTILHYTYYYPNSCIKCFLLRLILKYNVGLINNTNSKIDTFITLIHFFREPVSLSNKNLERLNKIYKTIKEDLFN